MNPHTNNAGAQWSHKRAVSPVVQAPATVNGVSIDRSLIGMPMSCKLIGVSGTRTGSNADVKLQDSADNSAWADYIPPRSPTGTTPGVAADGALTQIAASDTTETKNIDLSSARKFVRAVLVVAGGTTIAMYVGIDFAAGDTLPQT